MRKYTEGSVVTIPLRQGGDGFGVICRVSRGGILLMRLYTPRPGVLSAQFDPSALKPEEADAIARVGHLGIINGSWPIVGVVKPWVRDKWSYTQFVRYEQLSGKTFLVSYSDFDPNVVVLEQEVQPGVAEQMPPDGLMGYGYAEKYLSGLAEA